MPYCISYLQEKKTQATLREKEAQLRPHIETLPASSLYISGVDRSPTCPSGSREPKGDHRAERPLALSAHSLFSSEGTYHSLHDCRLQEVPVREPRLPSCSVPPRHQLPPGSRHLLLWHLLEFSSVDSINLKF